MEQCRRLQYECPDSTHCLSHRATRSCGHSKGAAAFQDHTGRSACRGRPLLQPCALLASTWFRSFLNTEPARWRSSGARRFRCNQVNALGPRALRGCARHSLPAMWRPSQWSRCRFATAQARPALSAAHSGWPRRSGQPARNRDRLGRLNTGGQSRSDP